MNKVAKPVKREDSFHTNSQQARGESLTFQEHSFLHHVKGFSVDEINRLREYFGFWSDSHSDKAHEKADCQLGKKLYELCGFRVPNRIAGN